MSSVMWPLFFTEEQLSLSFKGNWLKKSAFEFLEPLWHLRVSLCADKKIAQHCMCVTLGIPFSSFNSPRSGLWLIVSI